MKDRKYIILVTSTFLSLVIALGAMGLVYLLPGDFGHRSLITGTLLALSLLPLIIGVIQFRAMTAFVAHAEQFSTRDPLTNLYNRKTFWDFLGYEIERSRRQNYRFSIMIIDLDNFKAINDLYGHDVGDQYLLEFSALFKAAIRKGDVAARHGGDDFTAILPVCDEGQAYIAAKRLLDSLRDHAYQLPNGTAVQITASIGMAVFPDHATNAESLFLVAESMMIQAKTAGKDRMRLPSDEVNIDLLKSAGEKSIFIMDSIRKKQIVPYFQPIVSVKNRAVLAYEILTRIVTPEKVFPAMEFIEAAEGMGAIGKIDYLLVEMAFDQVRRNRYRGKLFFNLSPKSLVLNEFMPTIRGLMHSYGLEPPQMVFEVTERSTVKNLSLIERTVRELKQDGFQFAIDDFGSGYSSFHYIKLFKVDFLKLDGEFIRNMTGDKNIEQAIVSNIVSLAGDLGIKTVAEYVESEDILTSVRQAGIDYAQGYHIQRPLPDLIP